LEPTDVAWASAASATPMTADNKRMPGSIRMVLFSLFSKKTESFNPGRGNHPV
jgi:hypothetical protein